MLWNASKMSELCYVKQIDSNLLIFNWVNFYFENKLKMCLKSVLFLFWYDKMAPANYHIHTNYAHCSNQSCFLHWAVSLLFIKIGKLLQKVFLTPITSKERKNENTNVHKYERIRTNTEIDKRQYRNKGKIVFHNR